MHALVSSAKQGILLEVLDEILNDDGDTYLKTTNYLRENGWWKENEQ